MRFDYKQIDLIPRSKEELLLANEARNRRISFIRYWVARRQREREAVILSGGDLNV